MDNKLIAFLVIIAVIIIMYVLSVIFLKKDKLTENIVEGGNQMNEDKVIEYRRITFAQMDSIIKTENLQDYVILDVRTSEEYKEGRVPNSKLIPDFEINRVETEIPNKDTFVFVYCRSGNRSRSAVLKMNAMGYTNVYDVGGIYDYIGKIEQ